MGNRLKDTKEEQQQPAQEKESKITKTFAKYLDLSDYLSKEYVLSLLPFVFFLAVLGVLYISNTYYAERTIRRIDKISNELKELRSEYITSKSELMFKSKQSEVASVVDTMGIKVSVVPPKIIIVNKKDSIK